MIISDVSSGNDRQPVADLLDTIKRRKLMLTLPLVVGVGAGVAGYLTAPTSYLSEAVLVLDMRRLQPLPNEAAISPLPQDSPVLRSELDIINSRMMAQKVLELLQTDKGKGADAGPDAAKGDKASISAVEERRQIDALLSGLHVSNDGRSYTIFISYRASNPVYAAKVANAFASAYLDHQIDVQQAATRGVSDWLGEKLVTLRNDLETAERAAEAFRQQAGLAGERGQTTFQTQRVAALNAEIVAAMGAVSTAEARLQTAQALKARDEAPALTEVLASPAIQNLRNEQARVERKLDELKANGALKSAEIPVLTAEREALRQQISMQVDRIIGSLNNEILIARQRRADLEKALKSAEADLANANQAQVKAQQLDREANASRVVYESYLTRYKQLIEQDGIARPEAQLISAAEPPMVKASPRLLNWLLLGLGLGGLFAVAGTALREVFDKVRPVRTAPLSLPGIPAATLLPTAPRLSVALLVNGGLDPVSPFGRAIKSVHDRLRVLMRGRDSLALSVVSLSDGDGKSLFVTGLAHQIAVTGVPVAIIDATGGRSGLREAFGLPDGMPRQWPGGRKLTAAQLIHDHGSGIDIVTPDRHGQEGDWLSGLIAQLRGDHKVILVDMPVVKEDKHSILMACATDTALLVTSANHRDAGADQALVQTLASFGRKPALAVTPRPSAYYTGWMKPESGMRRFVSGLTRRLRRRRQVTVQEQI